jgi:hypothetical protein
MSLLNRGTEVVKVFQEIQTADTDADGNKITRASKVGTVFKASVQPLPQFQPTENQTVGFGSESRYRLRLINYPGVLGAQSQVEWRGKRYSIVGDGMVYTGSSRTRHVEYVMLRR